MVKLCSYKVCKDPQNSTEYKCVLFQFFVLLYKAVEL